MAKPLTQNANDFAADDRVVKNKRGIFMTVAGIVFFIFLVFLLFLNKLFTQPPQTQLQLTLDGVRVLNEPRPLQEVNLINQDNAAFSNTAFEKNWNLVFFGFTHCPHICPMALNEINRAYKGLPQEIQSQTNVYLITVDPERDSPEKLASYVSNFNQEFSGLTGDFVTLKSFAESLYVPFFKIREDALAPADEHAHHHHMMEDAEPTYDINHGSQVVIINPNGDYHGYYFSPVKADVIANSLPSIVANFNRNTGLTN
ncbi:SCO family protein [Sessilibacter corallicola]|uniref:SCO family protein n=1 Tax=Sessilibacter corallicola TaxID=2904075 RepID=UPI001E440FFE|nr:SCO family protein [Sessilibacter corallicola]MCE2028063.1 SCO family protein [Sessilibacter corallicola]